MVEVRELFKRVDRVRQSGFTGISTWKSRIPSAGTLSQNRLQRRRALCSVELSHLNYQEAPFESLNHLQNIRGMCARIKRQDYTVERKKKDVDLTSRPSILRRPVSSMSVKNRGKKQLQLEVGRPSTSSSPMRNINNTGQKRGVGHASLQYYSSRRTTLNNVSYKMRSTSSNATGNDEVTSPSDSDYSTSTWVDSKPHGNTLPGSGRGNPLSCMQRISPYQATKVTPASSHGSKYKSLPSSTLTYSAFTDLPKRMATAHLEDVRREFGDAAHQDCSSLGTCPTPTQGSNGMDRNGSQDRAIKPDSVCDDLGSAPCDRDSEVTRLVDAPAKGTVQFDLDKTGNERKASRDEGSGDSESEAAGDGEEEEEENEGEDGDGQEEEHE
uniref:Predicted protein n=1 Tax=Physcomitrium patens TaxID=3218 RepID=A9U350_PHYPA